ncbi:AAA family ATPase [Candidatus Dojkabacteria bacterium]|nr:AAA family ATPase [Candidatus Dojkabacteria bacterium]
MEITAISLKNFRKFESARFDFTKGVNVVMGENEAGKSTIMQAIISVLYVDVRTRSQKFYDFVTKWGTGAPSVIELEFAEGDDKYRLIKNFTESSAKLENLQSGKVLEDPSLIEEALARINPIKTDTVYRSTALIKQADVASIEKPADLSKAIENSLSTGSNLSLEEVLKELKKQENDLVRGLKSPAKNPGKIKELEDNLKEFKSQHKEISSAWEAKAGASEKEKQSAGKLKEIEEKIELIERMINNQKIFDEAEKEMEGVNKQLQEVQEQLLRVEKLQTEMERVNAKLSGYRGFLGKGLNEDAEQASKLKAQIDAKSKMLENMEVGPKQEKEFSKQGKNQTILILGVVAIAVGTGLAVIVNTLLGAISLVGFILVVQQFLSGDQVAVKSADRKAQDTKIEELKNSLQADQSNLNKILAKYEVSELKEIYSTKIKIATIHEEKNRLEAEIKGVLGEGSLEQLQKQQVELLTKKREIEVNKLTDEVRASKLSPEKYLEKRRELDKLKVERRKMERENVESQVVAEDEVVNYEKLVRLEENIENTEQRLEEEKEKLEVIDLTRQTLNTVKSDLSGLIQTQVLEKVEKDLPKLTQNRYKDIRLDGEFHLEAYSEEKNDWVDPIENLSSGTVDQIYFVYRLALLKMVEGNKKAPLLLDDVFVTYDKLRSEEAKGLLEREGQERQILLFTHDDDFKDWGNLVNIDRI